jgi:hypothetical protein
MKFRIEDFTLIFGTAMNLLLLVEYMPYEVVLEGPSGNSSRLAAALMEYVFSILS